MAVWTPQKLVIGSDSKITMVKKRDILGIKTSCKIKQHGSFFFTAAGLTEGRKNSQVIFSVGMFVTKASAVGQGIQEIATAFAILIREPFKQAMQKIKRENPAFYKERIEGKAPLQVAFAGFEDRTPVLVIIYFKVQSMASGRVSISQHGGSCPGETCNEKVEKALLGENEEMTRITEADPEWWNPDLVGGVRKLIQAAIEDKPDTVGPPIDILEIDSFGARWVGKNAHCPDIVK